MSKILPEPSADPARNYFSQQCVLLSGLASGAVKQPVTSELQSPSFLMGRRDAYHVVVAHLASSKSLRDAAEKCAAFGRGVGERAESHPYGAEWCSGFAQAALEASSDITMYAATGSLPVVNPGQLQAARVAVRKQTPLFRNDWIQSSALHEPPNSHREW